MPDEVFAPTNVVYSGSGGNGRNAGRGLTGLPGCGAADAATGPAAAGVTDGIVNVFWQFGHGICRPLPLVSHNIFCPHAGQENLKSLIGFSSKNFRRL